MKKKCDISGNGSARAPTGKEILLNVNDLSCNCMRIGGLIFILIFLVFATRSNAQPGDSIKRVDTLFVGDTLCFADSISSYVAEFVFPGGQVMTVRGVTNCVEATSRSKSGTRVYVTELIAETRDGKKVRLKRRSYYIK